MDGLAFPKEVISLPIDSNTKKVNIKVKATSCVTNSNTWLCTEKDPCLVGHFSVLKNVA